MSVDIDGKLPSPVYVGRDDVASLAMLAAISDLKPSVKTREAQSVNGTSVVNGLRRSRRKSRQENRDVKPVHWNIAVGWTGEERNGLVNAEKCMTHIVKAQDRRKTRERRKKALQNASPLSRFFIRPCQGLIRRYRQNTVKPYGVFVFLMMLLVVYPTIISAAIRICEQIPILQKAMSHIFSLVQPTLQPLRDRATVTLQSLLKKAPAAGSKTLGKVLIH